MIKNIFKIGLTLFGVGILVAAVITEMDGIGRFAMLLFGVLFSLIGSFMSFSKKNR